MPPIHSIQAMYTNTHPINTASPCLVLYLINTFRLPNNYCHTGVHRDAACIDRSEQEKGHMGTAHIDLLLLVAQVHLNIREMSFVVCSDSTELQNIGCTLKMILRCLFFVR